MVEKKTRKQKKIRKNIENICELNKRCAKKLIKEVNNRISRAGIVLKYDGDPKPFNSYHLDLFNKYYGIKENSKLCYTFKAYSPPTYSYSMAAIDFISEEIKKDPEHIVQNLKHHLKKKKS